MTRIDWATVRRLLVALGSFGPLLVLAFQVKPPDQPFRGGEWLLTAIAAAFLAVLLVLEVSASLRSAPRRYRGRGKELKIRNFMYGWIANGGRVAMFSHDLSWVNDDAMRSLLKTKAQNRELIVVVPGATELTRNLLAQGAEVLYYDDANYVIRSRFTVVRIDRADSAVAIGRAEGDAHVIEVFDAATHPAHSLATDLVEILRRLQR